MALRDDILSKVVCKRSNANQLRIRVRCAVPRAARDNRSTCTTLAAPVYRAFNTGRHAALVRYPPRPRKYEELRVILYLVRTRKVTQLLATRPSRHSGLCSLPSAATPRWLPSTVVGDCYACPWPGLTQFSTSSAGLQEPEPVHLDIFMGACSAQSHATGRRASPPIRSFDCDSAFGRIRPQQLRTTHRPRLGTGLSI